jgi:hypothetical protein
VVAVVLLVLRQACKVQLVQAVQAAVVLVNEEEKMVAPLLVPRVLLILVVVAVLLVQVLELLVVLVALVAQEL